MGLREKNKIKRRLAMIDAAIELININGFENTRLEDVAERAEVSPATLYNYFPTKGHLIGEIYLKDMQVILSEQEKIIESPPADPVDAIMQMYAIDIENIFVFKDRSLWREVYSTAIAFPNQNLSVANPLGTIRTQQYMKLVQKLKNHGSLCPHTDEESLSEVLSSINEAHFISRLFDRNTNMADILPRLKRNVEVVISSNLPS